MTTTLALFDLDHTLLSGDSDVLWCQFLVAQGLLPSAQLALNARMKASGNRMPVIFMSGESQPHETQAAQDSGAVHFLWKPFNTREMLAVIDRVLSDTPGP